MKRHICFKCKRKFEEEDLEKDMHTGENGLVYSGWKCKHYCGSIYHRDRGLRSI